jgi:hypothetical protein
MVEKEKVKKAGTNCNFVTVNSALKIDLIGLIDLDPVVECHIDLDRP